VGLLVFRTAVKAPTGLTATAISSSQISVGWNAPVGFTIAQYELERSANGSTGWAQIYAAAATSTISGGLAATTTYYYRVRALDSQGNYSPYSSVANATTQVAAGATFSPLSGYSSTGTFDNGSSDFTLLGSGFGAGPTIAFWDDFRGGVNGAPVGLGDAIVGAYTNMNSIGGTGEIPRYVTGQGRDGDSVANTLTPALSAVNGWAQMQASWSPSTQLYFARQYRIDVTDGSQGGTNQKDMWFGTGVNYPFDNDWYPGANQGYFSNTRLTYYFDGSTSSDQPNVSPPHGGYWRRDIWNFQEGGIKPTGAQTPAIGVNCDAFARSVNAVDGTYTSTTTNKVSPWGDPPGQGWNTVLLPGDYQDAGAGHVGALPHATHQYWDDLYIATGPRAYCRFLLGNAATIGACTALYVIPHLTWADGSITFRPVYTEWANWAGKHLYRATENNVITRVGFGL
jgi:hypothetical protein